MFGLIDSVHGVYVKRKQTPRLENCLKRSSVFGDCAVCDLVLTVGSYIGSVT